MEVSADVQLPMSSAALPAEPAAHPAPATSSGKSSKKAKVCRYDSSLGLLTKKFVVRTIIPSTQLVARVAPSTS